MPTGIQIKMLVLKTNQNKNKESNHLKDYIVHNWITSKLLSSVGICKEKTIILREVTTYIFKIHIYECISTYTSTDFHFVAKNLMKRVQEWNLDSSLLLCPTEPSTILEVPQCHAFFAIRCHSIVAELSLTSWRLSPPLPFQLAG